MAITFVSENTFRLVAGSSETNISLPAGIQEDDYVVVCIAADDTVSTTSEGIGSGATALGWAYIVFGRSGFNPSFEVAGKVMGATPDTVIPIVGEAIRDLCGIIQVWRGVDVTTPIDVFIAPGGEFTAASGNPTSPAITTVTDGALVICWAGVDDDNEAGSWVTPTGYTNFTAHDTAHATDNWNCTQAFASKIVATAGLETPGAFPGLLGVEPVTATTFALRPAATSALNNNRISAMHFQRHYEPITVGA